MFAEEQRREHRAGFSEGHAGSLLGVPGVLSECRHVAAGVRERRARPEWMDGAVPGLSSISAPSTTSRSSLSLFLPPLSLSHLSLPTAITS